MTPLSLLLALALQDPGTPPADTAREDVPIPEKVQAPTVDDDIPTVSIRTEANGDRVEEYRQGGRLYMVKVTPTRGPAYYLMDTDGNGVLNRNDTDPTVSPVYWTIYSWE